MAFPAPTPVPSGTQFPSPVPIIGPQYCAPYPVDLAIVRKVKTISDGDFVVTDVNGTVIFKVKEKFLSLHDRRVLIDGAGNPIVTVRDKIKSAHDRWQVFRGESVEEKDLIFSVKRSSILHPKAKLHIFLANNKKEDVCDFKIEGSWSQRSCVIYAGESSSIIAEMRKETVKSVLIGKDNFGVTIYPNIDYAFIVALIVILDGINIDNSYNTDNSNNSNQAKYAYKGYNGKDDNDCNGGDGGSDSGDGDSGGGDGCDSGGGDSSGGGGE